MSFKCAVCNFLNVRFKSNNLTVIMLKHLSLSSSDFLDRPYWDMYSTLFAFLYYYYYYYYYY